MISICTWVHIILRTVSQSLLWLFVTFILFSLSIFVSKWIIAPLHVPPVFSDSLDTWLGLTGPNFKELIGSIDWWKGIYYNFVVIIAIMVMFNVKAYTPYFFKFCTVFERIQKLYPDDATKKRVLEGLYKPKTDLAV